MVSLKEIIKKMDHKLSDFRFTQSPMNDKPDNMMCGFLSKFHTCLSKQFYKLGYLIACHPSYFIMVPVFLTLIFISGIQTMNYKKDPEYLFSPSNAPGRAEREVIETLFPLNYSYSFDPSRLTNFSPFARLFVTAKDKETILRTRLWDEIMRLNDDIYNLTIEWQSKKYKFKDLCAVWNSECLENQVLNLNEVVAEVENGTRVVDYPIMLFPIVLPFFYGGVKVNESEGYIDSLQAIVLHYWLRKDNPMEEERSLMWENKVLEYILNENFEFIEVAPTVSMSLEDELENNTGRILGYLPPTIIIVLCFSIISVFSFDWVRSKIQISVIGVLTAGLATGCGFGLLMYLQIPFIGINIAAPFLLLGIGIDDMFVVLSAWQRTKIQDEVPIRLATAYGEAAVSITITSLTNMLSFFIGAITPFPSVYIFCIYTGVSILLTYVFFISFFGGCLALTGYQERKQMHALSCKPIKSKSESTYETCCYRWCCSGGINKDDQLNPSDNKPQALMLFFRDYFATALNNTYVKALIIVCFVAYLSGAIYGCSKVKEGLDKKNLALDSSYLTKYYDIEDSMFRMYPYRIQIVINETIKYSDQDVKEKVLNMHNSFENLTYIGSKLFTQSWMRGFYRFLEIRPNLKKKITDEASFIKVLKEDYLTDDTPEFLDVVFNENETEIIASRFVVQAYYVNDTNDDKDMMLALRKVAEEAPFKVITYHPLFVFFDQFVLVTPLTIQTISLVAVIMMVVSFIFIPNPICSLCVILSIISIEIGVIGYMSLWGVSLDCISMINLIMCIGFSVDFSAHISYSYLTAKGDTPDEKVKECMFNLGLPVMQSGFSTIAGVFIFIVAPSSIFRTFFKIICLVIVFGTMHAILLLPVMLSLLGPNACGRGKKRDISKTIAHITTATQNKDSSVISDVRILGLPPKSSITQSSISSCSDSGDYIHGDSDTESTRASSQGQESLEDEGTSNIAYVAEEDETHDSTYL